MAYLVKADFNTHIYSETIDKITRNTDAIVDAAISEAIAHVKGYLSRYNRTKLFDPAASGFVADVKLKAAVKDIALWRMVVLANPNVSIEKCRTLYEDAIEWLESIQRGKVDPEGWPYKDDDADTDFPEGNTVSYKSNDKRTNDY